MQPNILLRTARCGFCWEAHPTCDLADSLHEYLRRNRLYIREGGILHRPPLR